MTPQELEKAKTAELERTEAELVAANAGDVDARDLTIPILKVGQPLTKEVTNEDAKAGDFINALTRESLGQKIEFIVSGYRKGHFKPLEDGGARLAFTDTVPWPDDPHHGEPWSQHPDAEENYRARVNAGEIPWGSGPPISTTHNFTGYVVGSEIPVNLALKRTDVPEARKWLTLLNAVLRGRYWDVVFELTTERASSAKGTFYNVKVRRGRKTTAEERQAAVELATVLRSQRVDVAGADALAEDEPGSKPRSAPEGNNGGPDY